MISDLVPVFDAMLQKYYYTESQKEAPQAAVIQIVDKKDPLIDVNTSHAYVINSQPADNAANSQIILIADKPKQEVPAQKEPVNNMATNQHIVVVQPHNQTIPPNPADSIPNQGQTNTGTSHVAQNDAAIKATGTSWKNSQGKAPTLERQYRIVLASKVATGSDKKTQDKKTQDKKNSANKTRSSTRSSSRSSSRSSGRSSSRSSRSSSR